MDNTNFLQTYVLKYSYEELLKILPTFITVPNCRRYLLWRSEQQTNGKKPLKVPYYASGGRRQGPLDSSEDRSRLVSLAEVCAAYAKGGYTGIGIAPGADDNGGYVQGIDLDNVWTTPHLSKLRPPGYIEASPSAKGIHIYGYGKEIPRLGSNGSGVEVNCGFLTVTGDECGLVFFGLESPKNSVCLADYIEQTLRPLHSHYGTKKSNSPLIPHTAVSAPKTKVVETLQPQTMADLRAALFFLSSDGRELWIDMGQALRWVEGGFALWEEWSKTSDNYNPNEDLKNRFEGFGGDRTGYKAVFVRAEANGWINPARKYEKPDKVFNNQAVIPSAELILKGDCLTSSKTTDTLAQIEVTSAPQPKIKIHHFDECRTTKKLSWLIKKIIPQESLGAVYGASGSGKSFLVIDMALAISCGVNYWCGHKVQSGRTIYVAAEGGGGFGMRLAAYASYYKVQENTSSFEYILDPQNLFETDKKKLDILIETILARGRVSLIIFDTLACSAVGADENSVKDMGIVIDNCKGIIEKTGATVLLIHHEGKDPSRGARGSSALKASFDFEIKVTATAQIAFKQLSMEITKLKDGENDKKYSFQLQPILLGMDEDEESIFSCVVLHDDSAKSPKSNPFQDEQKIQRVLSFINECPEDISIKPQAPNNFHKTLLAKKALPTVLGEMKNDKQYKEEAKRILNIAKNRGFLQETTIKGKRIEYEAWKITEKGHEFMKDTTNIAEA